jgi:hypothetical protein
MKLPHRNGCSFYLLALALSITAVVVFYVSDYSVSRETSSVVRSEKP